MTQTQTVPNAISQSVLQEWDERFLPPHDIFYFYHPEDARNMLFEDVVLYEREELGRNSTVMTMDASTAFCPWNVDATAKYASVVSNSQFMGLSYEKRKAVIIRQWELRRGQVYEAAWLKDALKAVELEQAVAAAEVLAINTFSVDGSDIVALNRLLWLQLTQEVRYEILRRTARLYSNEPSVLSGHEQETLKRSNPALAPYMSVYPTVNGPNCFAAALAGTAFQKEHVNWTISQWMHPQSFLLNLFQRGYRLHDDMDIEANDVLVWLNGDDSPVHACFALTADNVFNKQGQTMFNSWQVLKRAEVETEWEEVIRCGGRIAVYRRKVGER